MILESAEINKSFVLFETVYSLLKRVKVHDCLTRYYVYYSRYYYRYYNVRLPFWPQSVPWDVVTLYVTGKDEAKNESKVSIELETAYSIRALDRFMRRPITKEISQTHVRPTTSLFETERK